MAANRAGKKSDTSRRRARRIWALIATAALLAGSLLVAFPPQEKINQGLDIQGGLSVVLAAKTDDGAAISPEDMEKAKSIIETRVNALGASEASVQIQGDDQILVQIPGLADSSQALATIGKTGVLEFARLDSFTDEDLKTKIDNGSIVDYTSVDMPDGDAPTGALAGLMDYSGAKHIAAESGTYEPLFTGEHIENVTIGKESDTSQYYSVNIRLDPEATLTFADATTELLPTNGKIVILLDGEVNSAPAVQSAITGGEVSITGNYTIEDARALQTVLDSGSLPVSFTYEQSTTVGPTLGQGELSAGLLSMLFGVVLVMIYLIAFYRGFGLVPAANMIVFTVIYLGVLGALSAFGLFSLSLAGIAGIILSIGMTADSVILAIERFKEELKEGRSIKSASENGVRHAIVTSIDADVVSLITALSLFFLATSSIKGFGLTLALGILCDILVMLVFVAPTIRLLAPKSMKYRPGFWGIAYAEQLGDVRTGSHNYMLPSVAKSKLIAEKEQSREQRAADKQSRKEAKEREQAADKRAREIRKQASAAEKIAKKEALEELKQADAERDRARREAKSARRRSDRADAELEKAEAEEKKSAERFADALDDAAKAEDAAVSAEELEQNLEEREEEILEEYAKTAREIEEEADKAVSDICADEQVEQAVGELAMDADTDEAAPPDSTDSPDSESDDDSEVPAAGGEDGDSDMYSDTTVSDDLTDNGEASGEMESDSEPVSAPISAGEYDTEPVDVDAGDKAGSIADYEEAADEKAESEETENTGKPGEEDASDVSDTPASDWEDRSAVVRANRAARKIKRKRNR